ncbi:MAG: ATP-binding protein [Pseudomonadota bacterium]
MAPFRVALLGAESTGKTQLAAALAAQARERGLTAIVVGEVLRAWCDAQGRTPRADEQRGIAQSQADQVAHAPACDLLISDTTPLMVALYSDMLFSDPSLYPLALAHHALYDLTLVMGLDVPWVADGLQRDGPHVRAPVDALLRLALARGGVAYSVVYGSGAARAANAWACIERGMARRHDSPSTVRVENEDGAYRPWSCDKCSDPDCEHRLFSRLRAKSGSLNG